MDILLISKNDSISFRDESASFHMMLFWDKTNEKVHGIKNEEKKIVYKSLYEELLVLFQKNRNRIQFKTKYLGKNSTYGILSDWLDSFIQETRKKHEWFFTGKDLPFELSPIEGKTLWAHISRKEIKDETFLNQLLKIESVIDFQIVQKMNKNNVKQEKDEKKKCKHESTPNKFGYKIRCAKCLEIYHEPEKERNPKQFCGCTLETFTCQKCQTNLLLNN